ncbi:MAG: hypothetical protein JWM76_1888 [Pseudonocardiales bacterium]|nr:hypothetical protein [Pseudonocardiales bacterium]
MSGLVVVAALGLTACSGGSSKPSAATVSGTKSSTATSSTPTAGVTVGPTAADPTPTATPTNIDVPGTIGPVIRDGKTPTPTISAPAVPFVKGTQAAYPDGIAVQILSITQGTTVANGPGTIAGPKSTFKITFTNNSAKAIDMNQVVVTVLYGTTNLQAQPVYDGAVNDFSGTVQPGKSTDATYAFRIPTDQLNQVMMRVDFDGLHAAATFTGKVQPQ